MKTSEIEGEYLTRVSVHSSLRRQFGLSADDLSVCPREHGITLMAGVYRNWSGALVKEKLFN
ncbi:DUF4172 domain-containing protein [Rhizobium sp. NPDC090275]|uniref:DUF4172 domain-containing protein n=1 Tax=Rhizobium sp. NPDC090275 TaxID=3364498 RepID=UPI00383B0ACF